MSKYEIGFLSFPNEVLNEILVYCGVTDLCKLSQVCKKLNELIKSEYLWSQKWTELVKKSGLFFSSDGDSFYKNSGNGVETYHSRCKRLWVICQGWNEENNLPVCVHCQNKTCSRQGIEHLERKIAIDIGSKTTWLVSSPFSLQRHPSVLIIPPASSCHSLTTHGYGCILQAQHPQLCMLCPHPNNSITSEDVESSCDIVITNRLLQKNKTEEKTEKSCSFLQSGNFSETSPLFSGLRPTYQTKFPTCEIIIPTDSLLDKSEFHHLAHYLCHLFSQFQVAKELKKPNVTLMFCIPFNVSSRALKKLVEFLFEVVQASSVCFVNKALCTASLIGLETCLVVDSGASNTVVSLIVNNEILLQRTQHTPVGGVAIANYLAEAIKLNGLMNDVSVSSLDNSRVKFSCFLPYNIAVEERKKNSIKQNVFVRSTSSFTSRSTMLQKLELGPELYLAPEIMYAAMNLPHMIKEALKGLDSDLVKEALSHLLLTGSNTELSGFSTRLIRDLQMLMPEYAHIINVRDYAGSRSYDAVIGATRLILPYSCFSNLTSSGKLPSSLLHVTREEYILYGLNIFE